MRIVRLKPKDAEHAHRHFRAAAVTVPRDIDGYSLVWFKRRPDGMVKVNGTYGCRDPLDVFSLPSLAEEVIRSEIEAAKG